MRTNVLPDLEPFVKSLELSGLALDDAAIHAVENARRDWTAALHVYGGDIVEMERSA